MAEQKTMKFIVGLGNPGRSYAGSRHNIGFLVIDSFLASFHFPPLRKKRNADVTEGEVEGARIVVIKPRSYMNASGPPVREILSLYPIAGSLPGRAAAGDPGGAERASSLRDQLVVIHDDLDLPVGKVRFRGRGSSGGHRGVASIVSALGTEEFSRLKVGIGREEGVDPAQYVLEPLSGERRRVLLDAARRVAEMLAVWIREGVDACANRFNGAPGEPPGGDPA